MRKKHPDPTRVEVAKFLEIEIMRAWTDTRSIIRLKKVAHGSTHHDLTT